MKILFIGVGLDSSLAQYHALKKLYKNVDLIDTQKIFLFEKIYLYIFWKISPKIFEPIINQYILSKIKNKKYNLIFIRNIEFIGLKLILTLKNFSKKIIANCSDNPFVSRDFKRWNLCKLALKYYDLLVFHQYSRIKQAKKYNLKKTLFVFPPYDKKAHCPPKISIKEKKKLQNDIIFIGTWFPKRGKFIKKLYDKGLKIKIYGARWNRDKYFDQIKNNIVLGNVTYPLYSKLIYCSKIALGLVSEENLDEITRRSIEIPAIGSLLCAKRTKTHKKVFVENKEAIFFKDAKECVQKCKKLLQNEKLLKEISLNGHLKVTKKLKLNVEDMMKKIVLLSMKKKNQYK